MKEYVRKQIDFVQSFFNTLESKDRKKIVIFFILSILNNFIDFLLVFFTIILFEKNTDLFVKLLTISIASILYLVLKIMHSIYRSYFTDLTYIFRYSQIYKIGNEILNTDFEVLQSDTEQLKIEKAYFSIFSGGNKGLEFQLNELLQGISLIIIYIFSIILVFFFNPIYSFISIILCSFSFFIISLYTKINAKYKKLLDDNIASTNHLIAQEIKKENILDIKYTRRIDKLLFKNNNLNQEYFDIFEQMIHKTIFLETIEQFLPWLGLIVFLLSFNYIVGIQTSLSSIMFVIMLINYLLNQTNVLFRTLRNIYENFESIENWSNYFSTKSYLNTYNFECDHLDNLPHQDFKIKFDKIYYRPRESQNYILSDISLEITSKNKIAIVGTNGAGKTTLVNILLGLLKPSSGEIYINNQKIEYEYYKVIAKHIFSILPQENSLFNMTIAENISFSEINKDFEIYEALEKVGLVSKINKIKRGINSEISSQGGESGVEFSGGEKRLLLLSRMIYFQRKIGIFDEATSALDPSKEGMFYDLVKNKLREMGMIFISHKVGNTKFSDEILVLDKGNIVQRGNHKELLATEGKYRNMFLDEDGMEKIDENIR